MQKNIDFILKLSKFNIVNKRTHKSKNKISTIFQVLLLSI